MPETPSRSAIYPTSRPSPSPPRAPFVNHTQRDSSASTNSQNFSSIGNILSSPYDSDEESLATPRARARHLHTGSTDTFHGYPPSSPPRMLRTGDRRESVRNVDPNQLMSVEGEVIFSGANSMARQSEESGRIRPPTIVEFPDPQLAPSPEPQWVGRNSPAQSPVRSIKYIPSPSAPSTPPRQTHAAPQYPAATHPGLRSPYVPQPSSRSQPARPQITIPLAGPGPGPGPMPHFILPPPASPVSPYLATPPGTILSGPMAAGHRGSTASESIRGFDAMKEKKALFRGGEEEIVSPWSPRKREPRPSGLRNARPMTTVDFWKRFSTMRLDQEIMRGGKESAWLEQQQKSRKSIKIYAWGGIAAVAIIVAVIVTVVLIRQNNKTEEQKINNGL